MLSRVAKSVVNLTRRQLSSTAFRKPLSLAVCNPPVVPDVTDEMRTNYFSNPRLKKRKVPIQLRQSGDLDGDGIDATGHRMLIDARTRKGPFFHLSQQAGAWCFTHYNRMYHPRCIFSKAEGGMNAEYEHLTSKVAVINVAVERQICVKGPDAEKFVNMVITRNARAIKPQTCKYVIMCNRHGGIINDPVLLRLSSDEFWFSLADSDAGFYLEGVNAMGNYDCDIDEIDVAPLSLAGPYAMNTMCKLIGEEIATGMPYFGLHEATIGGCSVVVTRTGFSSEANFEIYLRDAHRDAELLYRAVMDAGAEFDIREICIPHHSRIEGGMLSWGQDIDNEVNPFECGLGWQVNTKKKEYIGRDALLKIKEEGATHKLVGLRMGGHPIDWYPSDFYHVQEKGAGLDDEIVGYVTSAWYSPSQLTNIALAMLPVDLTEEGTELQVSLPDAYASTPGSSDVAEVCAVPFKKIDSAEDRTGMSKTGKKTGSKD
jgi:glycine cleavage system aminomethyltransferase T